MQQVIAFIKANIYLHMPSNVKQCFVYYDGDQ